MPSNKTSHYNAGINRGGKGFGELSGDDLEFAGKTFDPAADRYIYREKAVGQVPRVTTDERGTP